jgi:hypothetical protein
MRKNRVLFWLLAGMLACSLAVTLSLGTAPSAHARSTVVWDLGGLDLKGYCQSLGDPSVTTIGNTYYSWRCVDRNGNNVQFSMQAACQWQYHINNAYDWTDNFYSATGGLCFRVDKILGGINARAYCQNIGAQDVILLGNTAYDWRCYGGIYGIGSYVPFDMGDACRWMYNTSDTEARFADFYTPTSWQCLG